MLLSPPPLSTHFGHESCHLSGLMSTPGEVWAPAGLAFEQRFSSIIIWVCVGVRGHGSWQLKEIGRGWWRVWLGVCQDIMVLTGSCVHWSPPVEIIHKIHTDEHYLNWKFLRSWSMLSPTAWMFSTLLNIILHNITLSDVVILGITTHLCTTSYTPVFYY
jgi:hypothetical protein